MTLKFRLFYYYFKMMYMTENSKISCSIKLNVIDLKSSITTFLFQFFNVNYRIA